MSLETDSGTSQSFDTAMRVAWEFDYDVEIEELRNLYSRAKQLQWNAETDIDWSQEVDPANPILGDSGFGFARLPFYQKLSKSQRETLRAHVAAHRLSQFLHGEQGALMTAATLAHSVPHYEAKLYSATQAMDEARHVEVFEKYVRKVALVYPMSPFLKGLIDATLAADHWVKIAIGMNIVVEGLALGSFYNMRRTTGCGLLRQIVDLAMRDEARHVAFGNVYVGATLRDMHPDDREDAAQFAYEALTAMAGPREAGDPGRGRFRGDPTFLRVLENSSIDPADFAKAVKEAREAGIRFQQAPGTVDILKDLVFPALVRVGAITERTRKLLAERGITVWEDPSVLESLEDSETGIIEMPET